MTWRKRAAERYWIILNDEVSSELAFVYDDDPDWLCFDIDDDQGFTRIHVDHLTEGTGVFREEAPARQYAIVQIEQKIRALQSKLEKLRHAVE